MISRGYGLVRQYILRCPRDVERLQQGNNTPLSAHARWFCKEKPGQGAMSDARCLMIIAASSEDSPEYMSLLGRSCQVVDPRRDKLR